MTIPHFSDQQNTVFIPALLALLVATVLICLPIVFAPALRRGRRAGRRALVAVAGVVAAAALVVTGWQAGVGVRTLQVERTSVASQLQSRYGIELPGGDVNELVNGGRPLVALPQLASSLDLKPTKSGKHALHLLPEQEGSDVYRLAYGGETVPQS